MKVVQLHPHTFGFKPYIAPGGTELLVDPSFDQALAPGRWQTNDPANWSIDPATGKALNLGGDGAIYQPVEVVLNTTYQIAIDVEARDGGGVAFQFINPENGSGFGYTPLGAGLQAFTVTADRSGLFWFGIKGNYGSARILSASLKT